MAWMLWLGEDGLSKTYTLPPDAEVQPEGQSIVCEVDIYCKLSFRLFLPF